MGTSGPGSQNAGFAWALPVVRIRLPLLLRLWVVGFTTFFVGFLSWVFVRGLTSGKSPLAPTLLIAVVFIGFPIAILVSMLRASLVTIGATIRLRSGVTTRVIPAPDIEGFVIVDQVGQRGGGILRRPAITLVPGSPSDLEYRWTNRGATARLVRRGMFRVANRWGPDIPITCFHPTIFSTQRADLAIIQLTQWHTAALSMPPSAGFRADGR